MGGGSGWSAADWSGFSTKSTINPTTKAPKPVAEIFSASMKPDYDPKKIKFRESCDSKDNPESTPIIIGVDGTGSMGKIPHDLITNGLNKMVTEIYSKDRKTVSNPHTMFLMIGDADHGYGSGDQYPFQATQFEADIRIAEQLKSLHIEGDGGGNMTESYHLAWYFAAKKTKIDSFDKRGEKGILFTLGDEGVPKVLTANVVRKVFGDKISQDIKTEDLLKMVEERYHVFHLDIEQGRNRTPAAKEYWKELLGQRFIPVADYTKVPEIIISTLEVLAGTPKSKVTASWDKATAAVVGKAIANLPAVIPASKGTLSKRKKAVGEVWRPGDPSP